MVLCISELVTIKPGIVMERQNKVNYFPCFVCLKLSNGKQTKTWQSKFLERSVIKDNL